MRKGQRKNLTSHFEKSSAEQSRFHKKQMEIAKICLESEPIETVAMLFGMGHHVIQTIPQRKIRERLILDAIRTFAGSLGPLYQRRPNPR